MYAGNVLASINIFVQSINRIHQGGAVMRSSRRNCERGPARLQTSKRDCGRGELVLARWLTKL